MKIKQILTDGLFKQNPVFRLVLGTCPVLAISTMAMNGLGMGLAVTFVLICSNVIISLLRNIIPDKVRIPAFILVIATFVTVVMIIMESQMPDLYKSLGIFLPLIVVNCVILARAEAFASSNRVGYAALDGLFMGLGYTLAITLIAIIREFLGTGAIFGKEIMEFNISILVAPAGAFIVYGLLIALFNFVYHKITNKLAHSASSSVAEVK